MSLPRESELSFVASNIITLPQPGVPVATRTREELELLAHEHGTQLATDPDNENLSLGGTYIAFDPYSRHYFDEQGRIVRIGSVEKIPVHRVLGRRPWNFADSHHDLGIVKTDFTYDKQGLLLEVVTTCSTNGRLWRIMDQQSFSYEGDSFQIHQPVRDGFLLFY